MAMKKKFLGLAMAAMVALPAAAYADTTFQWNEGQPQNVDVTVNGSVNSNTGIAPQGKLEVELPVSMDFSVDKNGTFTGTSYSVTNRSQHDVAVSVADFTETNKQGGIRLLGTNDLSTLNTSGKRNDVIMALVGDNNKHVDLGAFDKAAASQKELLVVPKNNGVGTIQLEGIAGKQPIDSNGDVSDTTGVAETFELVFQIKKKD